jgi:hypothetical protein
MTTKSIETTREWVETLKKGGTKRGKITYYTYENNVASEPKTRNL